MAPLLLRSPTIAAVVIAVVALAAVTTAAARPCRTFVISSYSIRNPSTNTFTTITEIRSLSSNPLFFVNNPYDQNDAVFASYQHNLKHQLGFSTTSYDFTSLRDRTKDILNVVIALLFGFSCGYLAAATIYLLWSVVSVRRDRRYDYVSDESSDDNGSEIYSAFVNSQRR